MGCTPASNVQEIPCEHSPTHSQMDQPTLWIRLVLLFIRLKFHGASMAGHGENTFMFLNQRNRKLNLQMLGT